MAKKIKLELTKPQFLAMTNLVDTISGMLGTGSDFDDLLGKDVMLFDRMLNKNGYKRGFE